MRSHRLCTQYPAAQITEAFKNANDILVTTFTTDQNDTVEKVGMQHHFCFPPYRLTIFELADIIDME